MNIYRKIILLVPLSLTACVLDSDPPAQNTDYQSYYQDAENYYPIQYESTNLSTETYPEKVKNIEVPETYHVGPSHSPVRHNNRDRSWVTNQNPNHYTIQLSSSNKPAAVAQTLLKAPKNERMAEIKTQHGGQSYYTGVYGSYSNYDDAKKALEALPEEVRQGAQVQNWQNIQKDVSE